MDNGLININKQIIHFEYINYKYFREESPILIFLHHGLGSSQQWSNFPKLLTNAVHCPGLLYDRQGYGRSEKLKEAFDVDFLEKEALVFLPGLIKELNIKNKVILVGHSDGGSIALLYASQNPDNLLCAIAEAPHVFVEDITLTGVRQNVDEYRNGDAKKLLSLFHGEKTDFTFNSWADLWLSDKFRNWNIEHLLPGIKKPVLVIYGDKDEYGTLKQLEVIKKGAPEHITPHIINDCGHFPHKQMKFEVKEIMKDFINTII